MSESERPADDAVDLPAIRGEWVGYQFAREEFAITRDDMLGWAEACGETDPRFVDPDHDDFQAHPAFTTHLVTGRILPEGFPRIKGRSIDGGKAVHVTGPVREGDTLVGEATIDDVYDKTGRSGRMVFVVQRMSFTNQRGEHVANVDWRMIRNQSIEGGEGRE
ncbi:MAG: MaoC family dehydratase N-terminal domain-containing protein [Actinomycetota bacterium]